MRKLIAAAGIAGVAAGAFALAAPASAGAWTYSGYSWGSYENCVIAGEQGIANEQWLRYDCRDTEHPHLPYEMWVFVN